MKGKVYYAEMVDGLVIMQEALFERLQVVQQLFELSTKHGGKPELVEASRVEAQRLIKAIHNIDNQLAICRLESRMLGY